jgi:hypothetical protein
MAGKRTAQRDHRAHAIRHHLGELARIKSAEAPADEADFAAVGVVHLFQQFDHTALHTVAQAEIATLLPAADGIAATFEKGAQRTRRDIGCHEARQHHHRMAIAARRKIQQRQRAEESAEFVDRASFEKHQGFGRGTLRLGRSRHLISSRRLVGRSYRLIEGSLT